LSESEQAAQNFSTAIKFGLTALDNCSVPLEDDDMALYDMEDDDEEADILDEEQVRQQQQQKAKLENINAQSHYKEQTKVLKERTLPFIIGTEEFMSDDMCGLNPDEEDIDVADGGEEVYNALDQPDNAPVDSNFTFGSGVPPPPPPPPPMMNGAPRNTMTEITTQDLEGGLFGSGQSLFDTADNNQSSNLFDQPENYINTDDVANEPKDIRQQLAEAMASRFQKPEESRQTTAPSLFGFDQPEEGDGLFGSTKPDSFSSSLFGGSETTQRTVNTTLTSEDTFDLGELEASLSIGGSKQPTESSKPKKSGFSFDFEEEEADSESLFGGSTKNKSTEASKSETRPKTDTKKTSSSLFFGEDEEDEFESLLNGKKTTATQQATPNTATSGQQAKPKTLFGFDEEEEEFMMPSKKDKQQSGTAKQTTTTQAKKSMFDEDDLDLDFKPKETSKATATTSASATAKQSEKKSLFSVDDEEEFMAPKKSVPTKQPEAQQKKSNSLFSMEEEDEFDFLAKTDKKPEVKTGPKPGSLLNTTSSLFDGSDDEVASPLQKQSKTPAAQPDNKKKVEVTPDQKQEKTKVSFTGDENPEEQKPQKKPSQLRKSSLKGGNPLENAIMKGFAMNIGGGPSKSLSRIRSTSNAEPKEDIPADSTPDPLFATEKASSPAKEANRHSTPDLDAVDVSPVNRDVPKEKKTAPLGGVSVFGAQPSTTEVRTVKVETNTSEESSNADRDGTGGQTLTHLSLGRPKRSKNRSAKKSTTKVNIPTASDPVFQEQRKESSPVKVAPKQQQPQKSSLFESDFDFVPVTTKTTAPKKEEPKPVQKKTFLFDELDDEPVVPVKKEPTKPVLAKTSSLFDEDEEIVVKSKTVQPAKSTPPVKRSSSLFESDDESEFASPLANTKKNNDQVEQQKKEQKEKEERERKEQDERERVKQREAAERLEREEQEKRRLQQEKEERLAQEEQIRLQREAENREQERLEQERLKKEQQKKLQAEREEQERLEQLRLEQERLQREQQEREEQERLKQEQIRIQAEKEEQIRLQAEKQQQKPSQSTFDNDFILASNSTTKSTNATKKVQTEKKKQSAASLFEEEDVLAKPSTPTKSVTPKTQPATTSVDDLFNVEKKRPTKASVSVDDLFGGTTKKSTTTTTQPKTTGTAKKASTAAKGLFGEEEDIFAKPAAKTAAKKPAAKKLDTSDLFDF
jgi:hypothetical protein